MSETYDGPVVDACVFHEWPSTAALADYLDPGWNEVILRPGDRGGPLNVRSQWLYRHPLGAKADVSYPDTGPPGSDIGLLKSQVLDEDRRTRVVLGYDDGLLAMGVGHYHLARVVARAANRWTSERWLAEDDRLYGLVLVCASVPETAAADVREFGVDERMVGIALGANGLGRAFGHAAYHPIYEAAAELDLPLVIQVGSDAIAALDASPTAGGLPATYAEYSAHAAHTQMGHVGSLIVQGVFDRFPNLRVLLVGGGAAWAPAYVWRLDYWFKTNSHEAPWLRRLPSEYFREHVRLATASLEAPRQPGRLAQALGTLAGIERILVYTSCYPNRDAETPTSVAERLPAEWHDRVFRGNADDFFRWPDRAATPVGAAADERSSR